MGFFCLHLHYNKENKKHSKSRTMPLHLFVQLVMRLQSHLNREQNKSGAIRTVCVNFVPYRLFGGGRARVCLNSRSRRPPPSPHPKESIKIGLSPYRLDGDFCHLYIEDWGVIRFVGVEQRTERQRTEQSKSGVGNATSVASKQRAEP